MANERFQLDINYLEQLPTNDYILGPGDEIRITISRDYKELDTLVTIDGEGTVYLPKLHRVYISELSVSELNRLLDIAYKKFVKYPEVETRVVSYRPIKVVVKGELENPGIQSLVGSFRVEKLVQKIKQQVI